MGAKSKNTTWMGIAAILGSLTIVVNVLAGNAEFSMENIGVVITGISTGIGLLLAKDANVTGAGDNAVKVD